MKTFRARILWIAPDIPEVDLGEELITLDADFATFQHNGQSVSGSVAEISPADWEKTGATPTVRVNRSLG